jgi:transposase
MGSVAVYVGLDYHCEQVQVCVLDGKGRVLINRKVPNNAALIDELARRCGTEIFAAIEACTGAAALADELIGKFGWSVDLAHPGYVARLKQRPDKTDLQDAQLLADLERVGYLPRVWLAPATLRELRRVVRYRQMLVAERRNAKLRIGALLRESRVVLSAGRAWTRRWLDELQLTTALGEQSRWIIAQLLERLNRVSQEIAQVERRLEELTADDSVVERLRREKGVGLVTAVTLRAEIGRFDRFRTGKQMARFIGLSPRNASSGQRQADAGLVRAGNPQLRATLIELAHRLIRYEERWTLLAYSLKDRGKPTNVVVAAVANRWVRWLHHVMTAQVLAA